MGAGDRHEQTDPRPARARCSARRRRSGGGGAFDDGAAEDGVDATCLLLIDKQMANNCFVKTIHVTMNEDLFARLDSAARRSNTTQSEFMRKALREALNKITTLQREEQHRRGYAAYP